MPFSTYLQNSDDEADNDIQPPTFTTNVQFQLPSLILGPSVAPGGGAEVLPAGIANNQWFNTPHIPIPQHSHFKALVTPSPLGLPVYSASGFDLLSILARVATRPNPKIVLGPVDMTCSFVVTDSRRFDNPIVYASPSFCTLTGYSEQEVLGNNCRFLQAPHANVHKDQPRKYTSTEAVNHLRSSLSANKECQTSLINYRKDGSAFINLVTVIPIPGGVLNTPQEVDEYVYHVGFQVDLTEQPNVILNKLRDGSYAVNYSAQSIVTQQSNPPPPLASRDWRSNASAMPGTSKELKALLTDTTFVNSLPLQTQGTPLSTTDSDPFDGNKLLHLLLLQSSPDFVHVVSLKGAFLYVAPSVKRVLGWAPQDLLGKSVTDFCHPADIVPLMRELKESSTHSNSSGLQKVVDLLFRIRAKPSSSVQGNYLWLESRGRLHIEPGKGRKAIILTGRVRPMPVLSWNDVPPPPSGGHAWALLSPSATFLFLGASVKDILGWGPGELIGKPIVDLIRANPYTKEELIQSLFAGVDIQCDFARKEGAAVTVKLVVFRSAGQDVVIPGSATHPQPPPRPLTCLIRVASCAPTACAPPSTAFLSVFEELDPHRNSTSWQYELQQLKYANQRLQDAVAELEGSDDSRPRSVSGTKRSWDTAHGDN